ncbi:LysM repeat-containing protein [Lactobacillus bombicola]|uniref:LysM repeat-containing protein n=1 Tax=Lactobacillus bombicola TaxID=1505723 RepID=A0A1I1TYQ8_9LACO|nr:LysM peptidoglycan-binding domain-containing protein [Lactobacillus bombicola]SFD60750.1 LysM repeat-containing protein [Lactobacillus bombicola]
MVAVTARKQTKSKTKKALTVKQCKDLVKKDKNKYTNAKSKTNKYSRLAKESSDSVKKSKYIKLNKKWLEVVKSTKKKMSRDQKKLKVAKAKEKIGILASRQANLQGIADQVEEHPTLGKNEGNAAIYRSDGNSTEVIFISPVGGENEDNATDLTTWAVDKGAPRKDYARTSSKTITITGLITGDTSQEAENKYAKLEAWKMHHYELTYKGRIYYQHLILTGLNRSYDGYRDNIKCNLTFQFAYAAKVTTSTNKKSKKKTSKSSKTTRGSRNKKYAAITLKPGNTLWGLSQKYGKSVAWLQKVNHIKGTTIYTGKKLRVS